MRSAIQDQDKSSDKESLLPMQSSPKGRTEVLATAWERNT